MTSEPLSPWTGWANAEAYEAYVRDHPVYRWLNGELVVLAELEDARRVLDLACGTGATARAALARLSAAAELVGVDGAAAMVGVARSRVDDPRASFRVAAAGDLERAVDGPFDRVLCNAALWQFPHPGAVIAAVAALLAPGGLFVFNLPASRLRGDERAAHPFQVALSRAVAARGGGTSRDPGIDPRRLRADLEEAGFSVVDSERRLYHGRQAELMALMEIPAMLGRAAPGLVPAQRAAALAEARRNTDPEQPVEVAWHFWRARRG